ncbi:MAG TPA: redox-regulated ATPase YchF [Bacteroidales bacterium]|nr:redox-regulated ATPase YchF [Bacteroidales bacterium]
MGLQCGIVGLTNVGKTTLFNCFSNTKAETSDYAFSASKSNVGTAFVPDPRMHELRKRQPSEKLIHTTVEILDIPGLAKGANQGEGVGNKFLADLRNTDAIIHVLRCFDSANLPHIEGSIDPVRDIEILDFELQVKDLESVEKKIQRYEKLVKAGDKEAKKGIEVLQTIKAHLDNLQNIRTMGLTDDEYKFVADLSLLTVKPIMYVCNVDDASAKNGNKYSDAVVKALEGSGALVLVIAALMESEISELESEEERMEFLSDAGLSEPGVNRMLRAAYALLNLQTFFTIGPKEIRAWTMKKGYTAPNAAGVIHSDLERGFIRAEVMKYNDFITIGSELACKNQGKLHIEGKTYIVEDGDILNIRFNV